MGSAKSVPRKITIDNPEDATIIKVTENVVERLQDVKTPKTSTSDQSPLPPKSISSATGTDMATSRSAAENATAATVYVTSHQIRNQIDTAIEHNNAYWESRVKALREGYSRINAELKNEYDRALAEVNQSWGKPYLADEKNDTQSCKNTEQELIKCYNSNRDRSLLCNEHVKHFNQCVSNQTSVLLKAN